MKLDEFKAEMARPQRECKTCEPEEHRLGDVFLEEGFLMVMTQDGPFPFDEYFWGNDSLGG